MLVLEITSSPFQHYFFLFLAPDALLVDLNPLSTKPPAATVTHKNESVRENYRENVDEIYVNPSNSEKSDEYLKNKPNVLVDKNVVGVIPTARTAKPTIKVESSPKPHSVAPSVKGTQVATKPQNNDEAIDQRMDQQNEQNLEDFNGINPADINDIEGEKSKVTEVNPGLEGIYLYFIMFMYLLIKVFLP